jgi:hypothetical protein
VIALTVELACPGEDAYVLALLKAGFDGHGQHGFDGGVAFVEVFGQ